MAVSDPAAAENHTLRNTEAQLVEKVELPRIYIEELEDAAAAHEQTEVALASREALIRQIIDLRQRFKAWIIDRRNAVLGRSARHDFAEFDGMAREIGVRPFGAP